MSLERVSLMPIKGVPPPNMNSRVTSRLATPTGRLVATKRRADLCGIGHLIKSAQNPINAAHFSRDSPAPEVDPLTLMMPVSEPVAPMNVMAAPRSFVKSEDESP